MSRCSGLAEGENWWPVPRVFQRPVAGFVSGLLSGENAAGRERSVRVSVKLARRVTSCLPKEASRGRESRRSCTFARSLYVLCSGRLHTRLRHYWLLLLTCALDCRPLATSVTRVSCTQTWQVSKCSNHVYATPWNVPLTKSHCEKRRAASRLALAPPLQQWRLWDDAVLYPSRPLGVRRTTTVSSFSCVRPQAALPRRLNYRAHGARHLLVRSLLYLENGCYVRTELGCSSRGLVHAVA